MYEHHDYKHENDIPFLSDGADSIISSTSGVVVDKAKGTSGDFKGQYARKLITLDGTNKENQDADKRKFGKEAKMLARARHNHVMQLIITYFYGNRFVIVMDRADGNLQDYLKKPESRDKVPQWFGCLISVMAYIHRIGIRHRDIKPTNILIKDEKVLLADFGIFEMGLGKTTKTTKIGRESSRTREYYAPEVEEGSTRGRSADIFSLGVVFLEMLLAYSYPEESKERKDLEKKLQSDDGRSYAKNICKVKKFMANMERTPLPGDWQPAVLSLCVKMLEKDRNKRPLAKKLSDWTNSTSLTPCKCAGADSVSGIDEEVKSLHRASADGKIKIVQSLLASGANVDVQDEDGKTALHYAARKGHVDVVRELLGNDADVMIEDDDGWAALKHAVENKHKAVVELFEKETETSQGKSNKWWKFAGTG
jgi:serine/threonine protein kinase